jgi:NAD+ synthase
MDQCLAGLNASVPAEDTARASGLSVEQVERAYREIEAKRRATRYLHAPPLLVRPIEEV